jgi:predicted metal-binding membrane protein
MVVWYVAFMTEMPRDIERMRGFTKRPVRLLWAAAALGSIIAWWSIHIVARDTPGWASLFSRLCATGGFPSGIWNTAAIFALWATMSLAMMLPSAVPMISTYLDIGDAARRGNQIVAPAGYLVGGYIAIWLGFALVATGLQLAVELTPAMTVADRRFAAGLLLIAGLFQFAPLKHACLSKCRSPMPYFVARWSDRAPDVFRMGLEQGVLCLACCWALMLLMFAAGVMNVAWMAGLAVLITLEKTLPSPKPVVYGSGAGLIAAGLFALVWS